MLFELANSTIPITYDCQLSLKSDYISRIPKLEVCPIAVTVLVQMRA